MGRIRENPDLRDRVGVFDNRFDAGRELAEEIDDYRSSNAWVMAVPAGGVPVGVEISERLGLRFDLVMVRKIHVPWNPEAGFGSISWDGTVLFNEDLMERLDLTEEQVEDQIEEEKEIIEKRTDRFRGERPFPDLEDEVVLLADDGMASGFTMLASIRAVKERHPAKITVAVPTASKDSVRRIEDEVDEVVCLNIRSGPTFAVARAYKDWHDLSDDEVVEILERSGYRDID